MRRFVAILFICMIYCIAVDRVLARFNLSSIYAYLFLFVPLDLRAGADSGSSDIKIQAWGAMGSLTALTAFEASTAPFCFV